MAEDDGDDDDRHGDAKLEGGCCLLEGCAFVAVPAVALMLLAGYQWWPLV